MNEILIILVLVIITTIMGMILAISLPAIKEFWKFRMAKKEGKAIFRIIGIDNRMKTYMKKLDKSVTINEGTYITDTNRIIYEKGTPVLTYFEGDSFPIDFKANVEVTKHSVDCTCGCIDKEPNKDPKLLNILFRRAKNSGKLGNAMDGQKMLMMMMGLGVAVVCTCILVFQMKTQITNMELQMESIKAMVGALT